MAKRGRPEGHKLSQESKDKIAKSKTGQKHSWFTKRKIRKGIKKWYKSEEGQLQKARIRAFQKDVWNSEEGRDFRDFMSQHYNENFKGI